MPPKVVSPRTGTATTIMSDDRSAASTNGGGGGLPTSAAAAPNAHFLKPTPLPTLPWEMNYEERRSASHDPRIVKQVQDERQWDGTIVLGVWKHIRQFAQPHKDWLLTLEEFIPLLNACGISSPHLIQKLFEAFDLRGEKKKINALVICKVVELGLTLPDHQDEFIRHCFERIDRPGLSLEIDKTFLSQFRVANPDEQVKGKGGKGALPLSTRAGANYGMLEGLRRIFLQVPTADPAKMTYAEFKTVFLDPANALWVGSFCGPLFESVASNFGRPKGKLPYIPIRWLKTTVAVPQKEEVFDADSLLLRELERNGGVDPTLKVKKKKKSSAESPPKKKS